MTLASTGREAVEHWTRARAEAPFDLVLMDVQMPEMDGFPPRRPSGPRSRSPAGGSRSSRSRPMPCRATVSDASRPGRSWEAARNLEQLGRAGDLTEAPDAVTALRQAMDALLVEIAHASR